jgi:hypothetical protein
MEQTLIECRQLELLAANMHTAIEDVDFDKMKLCYVGELPAIRALNHCRGTGHEHIRRKRDCEDIRHPLFKGRQLSSQVSTQRSAGDQIGIRDRPLATASPR